MSKMATLAHTSHTHKNVYFIQKGVNYNYPNWVFYLDFYKIHNKVIYGHSFISKTSDASHPQMNLRYLK